MLFFASVTGWAPSPRLEPPLYKQCDALWANVTMGTSGPGEQNTICHEGCAMSCVAMALAGSGFTLPDGGAPNPGSLNSWLQAHDGYTCDKGDCNNLVLDAPNRLTGGRMRFVGEWNASDVSLASVAANLASKEMTYVAHVRIPPPPHPVRHFVLLTGFDNSSSSFTVLDPGYDVSTYAVADVHDYLLYETLPTSAVVPSPGYPLFKQCDPRWGADTIVTTTICAVGCLLTSTAMMLRERHISIGGDDATPARLNTFLQTHGGYDAHNDMSEAVVAMVDPARVAWTNESMHTKPDVSWTTIVQMLERGAPVIANVMHGHHFVLVVGYDKSGDTLFVNDPGFSRSTYSFADDVVGWRFYNITGGVSE